MSNNLCIDNFVTPIPHIMTRALLATILGLSTLISSAQTLVDSIPYPDLSQGFWGIHVTPDTIFLGDDFSGDIYFSDHAGNILGQQATGFSFNHGLIRRANSYLIAQDYTANGAHLYEVAIDGTLLNTWTFPDVIGGHSSGIGGICADGDAIWYTMYYPDLDVYPYAYAYKWVPGDATPIDTVPLLGAQPQGLALKGDTLFYVMDDNDDDPERIHAYDLVNENSLGHVDLPDMDSDGDQSPRGLYCDGQFLYLVANRSGGSAFAFQTIFIYALDTDIGIGETASEMFPFTPNPADDRAVMLAPSGITQVHVFSSTGLLMGAFSPQLGRIELPTAQWPNGMYLIRLVGRNGSAHTQRLAVQH